MRDFMVSPFNYDESHGYEQFEQTGAAGERWDCTKWGKTGLCPVFPPS